MIEFIHQIRWRPVIGDPTIIGWITVMAYAGCAATTLLTARRAKQNGNPRERKLWLFVTILMALLCINKQLDVQSLFTDIGRVMAWHEGWYQQRRIFQKWFVMGIIGTSCLVASFLAWRFQEFWKRHFLLASGLTFILTFIVVRAISFHHIDLLLKSRHFGFQMNWILELGGISLVWAAALQVIFRSPRQQLR